IKRKFSGCHKVKPTEVKDQFTNVAADTTVVGSSLLDQEMKEDDSDLESMPDDEIEFMSGFEEADDNDSENAKELSVADEATADDVIDELVDMAKSQDANLNVSAAMATNSDPLKVADKIDDSVPQMVADVFEERLHELLSNTLKNILPRLLKDYVKKAMPKFDKRVKKTLRVEVPIIILKPLNKEFNALNTMESRRWNAKHQMQLI
ncbi:hypothetical protein Tco_1564840, partial [Tanacetum coccineum]